MPLTDLATSYALGLLTPLTAACVLPLYPGFLAYLADQFSEEAKRRTYALFGVLVTAGVLTFMLVLGLVFTTVLQQSLTTVIGIASPFAFVLLAIISVGLLLDVDASRVLPHVTAPETGNPLLNAFGFGFFFGAIVIPCNPGFIAVFFARTLLFTDPVTSMVNVLLFGLGIGTPLMAFSLGTAGWSQSVIAAVTRYRTHINRVAGAVMLVIALYYLLCVFTVVGTPAAIEPVCTLLSRIVPAGFAA